MKIWANKQKWKKQTNNLFTCTSASTPRLPHMRQHTRSQLLDNFVFTCICFASDSSWVIYKILCECVRASLTHGAHIVTKGKQENRKTSQQRWIIHIINFCVEWIWKWWMNRYLFRYLFDTVILSVMRIGGIETFWQNVGRRVYVCGQRFCLHTLCLYDWIHTFK